MRCDMWRLTYDFDMRDMDLEEIKRVNLGESVRGERV